MKDLKLFSILLVVLVFVFVTSCNKDYENITILSKGDVGFRGDRLVKDFESFDSSRHADIAKVISKLFESPTIRQSFDSLCREANAEVFLLSEFLYNSVLENSILSGVLMDAVNDAGVITISDLFNEYLWDYPGLEISFLDDSAADFPNIAIDNLDFEVVLVYGDADYFPRYIDGIESGNYHVTDEPTDKIILKLKENDRYLISHNSSFDTSNVRNGFSDLLLCEDLKNYMNNKGVMAYGAKIWGGSTLNSPLSGLKVFEIEELFDFFNATCSIPPDLTPPLSPPSGPTVPPCDADRDDMVNGRETIIDIKCPNGKDILRDCDTWCSYWDEKCKFQVDVFIPVLAPSGTEFTTLGSLMKVFSVNEKKLRQKKLVTVNVPITEWLFLEGKHGDEWQYTWTGRHRKRGEASETTIGFAFSAKVTFKVDTLGIELGPSTSMTNKITRANKDCALGVEISRYCRPLPEFMSLGDIEYHVNEQ